MNQVHRHAADRPPGWRAEVSTPSPCYEWTGFGATPGALGTGADRPGAVCRETSGAGCSLHTGPDRWLVAAPSPATVESLQMAQRQGVGAAIEVTGKWRRLRLIALPASAGQAHPLSAALPIELMLADRECASLWAFDCPVIVVRGEVELELWVEASYEAGLLAMLATLGVAT